MKVSALVKRSNADPFLLEELMLDDLREDEVLVKIHGVGLCQTDLSVGGMIDQMAMPMVLGHEGAGIVAKVGSRVEHVKPGDAVILTFSSCGVCESCEVKQPAYCDEFVPLNFTPVRSDGSTCLSTGEGEPVGSNFFGQSSFANYSVTHARNVVVIDKDLPIEILGPLACGFQTGAGAVMRSLAVEKDASILILGGGSVGLAAVMGAVLQGCGQILVSDPIPERRSLAIEVGATTAINPIEGNLPDLVHSQCPKGVDYILDTTASEAVQHEAISCLSKLGTVGLVGTTTEDMTLPFETMAIISKGQSIRGIVEGDSNPQEFIPQLIDAYVAGKFPLDKLVTKYALEDISLVIEDQKQGRCVKPILIP